MNTNQSKPSSTKRSQYSPQFKDQAVERVRATFDPHEGMFQAKIIKSAPDVIQLVPT